MRNLLLLIPLFVAACAYDKEPAPADTTAANDAELCEHFTGEDPYDGERAAYIQQRIERYCH